MFFAPDRSYSIDGKVALVTGALGAIGMQITKQLLQGGARVVLVDIVNSKDGADISRELDADSAVYVQADLCHLPDIERMLNEGVQAFEHIDILVNNAGVAQQNKFYVDETSDNAAAAIDLNLRAPMEATRLFVKQLHSSGRHGVVVNVASIAGLMPARGFELYGTTKAGLLYFTEASRSLAPQVRVAAVAPFFVNTPMVARARNNLVNSPALNPHALLQVNDVADAVISQIENRWSAGKAIMLVGSWQLIPVWTLRFSYYYVVLVVWLCLLVGQARSALGLHSGSKYRNQ
ncbi:hypothetical protein GGI04_001051 [Coemansia thaxteri]|uniref:Uncharacterized protein n=1 Tax=Coemansia thaxteri TaxID=2663907 RepID=A0A9W8BIW5_9FUNG|nr:hypothetical protein H4R26_001232 [Coemansia thaxteri]KAJ2008656.1 hypothetical protein GGI04_001051 [Coemansia thaxteri]KAJ2472786.1 hypothetical protein GGI02_001344 [Coemansia sp. RSA 2322]KAJ2485409.1 hypothetical protein EV174_001753 [Coemansia sp. RSA 2320]